MAKKEYRSILKNAGAESASEALKQAGKAAGRSAGRAAVRTAGEAIGSAAAGALGEGALRGARPLGPLATRTNKTTGEKKAFIPEPITADEFEGRRRNQRIRNSRPSAAGKPTKKNPNGYLSTAALKGFDSAW